MADGQQPDSSGLHTLESSEAPEVVSYHNNNYGSSPEVLNPPPPQAHSSEKNNPDYTGHYAPKTSPAPGTPTLPAYESSRQRQSTSDGKGVINGTEVEEKPDRRCFGMRRKLFIMLAAAVAVLVVIAIVLGAVLGTVLSNTTSPDTSNSTSSQSSGSADTSSSNSTLKVSSGGGLATISSSTDNSSYVYYQDSDGRVMEAIFNNREWTSISGVPALVTTDAMQGSPLAATTYTFQGVDFRTVVYVDANGAVKTTNYTNSGPWSTPYSVLQDDAQLPGSIALSVCSGTSSPGLNGIRLYYGSQKGIIQEVGMDFDDSIWYEWASFDQSDANSGVSCALVHNYSHLYLRNKTTKAVTQWQWNYVDVSNWYLTSRASSNATASPTSDIAVAYDGSSTDYIHWQGSDGSLVRAIYYGDESRFEGSAIGLTAASGSKLGASYVTSGADSGAMLLYQNAADGNAVQYDEVSRSGVELGKGSLG